MFGREFLLIKKEKNPEFASLGNFGWFRASTALLIMMKTQKLRKVLSQQEILTSSMKILKAKREKGNKQRDKNCCLYNCLCHLEWNRIKTAEKFSGEKQTSVWKHDCFLTFYIVNHVFRGKRDGIKESGCFREKLNPSWAQIMQRKMVSYPDHGSGYKK